MNVKHFVLIFLTWAVLTNALPHKIKQRDGETAQKEVEKSEKNDGGSGKSPEEKIKIVDLPDDAYENEEDEEDEVDEEDAKHMTACLAQENVTEEEMKNFLSFKTVENIGEPLKKAVLCFLKKIEFFDGKTWNVKNIADTIGEGTQMFKSIKSCLEKDDVKLSPHERTFRVQKCVLLAEKSSRPQNQ